MQKSLLEMSEKHLLKLFIEAVIDASDRFMKKRADDFETKLQGVYDAMPDAFEMQKEQEKEINARLNGVGKVVDRHVSQKRARLLIPRVFVDDYDEGWGPDASLFDVVSFTHKGSRDHDIIAKFVSKHAKAFQSASMEISAEMKDIEKDADNMKWPAPWRRYTQWGSVMANVNRFIDNVAEYTKT